MSLPIAAKYIVKNGDTLYKIARAFNITIAELLRLNDNINPYILLEGQVIVVANKTSNVYESKEYNVRFKYPFSWRRVDNNRYEGETGFFHVSAISSIGSIEDVCKSEACHRLLPYGSRPTLQKMQHLGKNACIIKPSDDQAAEMKNQAAFILEYPYDVEIQGEKYNYFLLWASKEHIVDIVKTLKFIDLKRQ